jgi:hypothetical protein
LVWLKPHVDVHHDLLLVCEFERLATLDGVGRCLALAPAACSDGHRPLQSRNVTPQYCRGVNAGESGSQLTIHEHRLRYIIGIVTSDEMIDLQL